MNEMLLIVRAERSEMDEALLRLAGWLGLESRVVMLPAPPASLDALARSLPEGQACAALSATTLAALSERLGSGADIGVGKFLSARFGRCLVYGFNNEPAHATALSRLGCPGITGLRGGQEGPRRFRFSAEGKTWLRQLAGLDFEAEGGGPVTAFDAAPDAAGATPLLFADDRPVFVRSETAPGRELFLWATTSIADVESPMPAEARIEALYPALLPALVFLKAAFGARCWHNPEQRARLIIDDPLLRPQYGSLRFQDLLNSMERARYGTTIAFIPWNFRRSKKAVAKLFQESDGRLSICVHGCDHTNQEFSRGDEADLTDKAGLALERMRQHHQGTGVVHANVMVFPQGHFSVGAMGALRRSGFLAAVNTSCYPLTMEGRTLSLGELMLPAVTQFHGFPVFPRRYPTQLIGFAVDLFLGRAALVVEHQDFLRNGYGPWEDFVGRLNRLDDRLTWPGLSDIVTDSCLQRVAEEDRMEVRFFTPTFRWRNRSARPVRVRLSRFEPEPTLVREVRVEGQSVPFEVTQGFLRFELAVTPGSVIRVEVRDTVAPRPPARRRGVRYDMSVLARRRLSEFRDDWLTRNPKLLGLAKGLMRRLKLTGDSKSD